MALYGDIAREWNIFVNKLVFQFCAFGSWGARQINLDKERGRQGFLGQTWL